jgi:hypothetical protein
MLILNISQYCHYGKDHENQVIADKERSIVLKFSLYFTTVSNTFEIVLYCPSKFLEVHNTGLENMFSSDTKHCH